MKNNGLNVLSLFDGISGGYLALKKAGITINNYYSSEIDTSALAVQNYHYSGNTQFHQLGDVTLIDGTALGEIDLVIFGSPCTQLSSINGKDKSGLEGSESKLFYDALRILKDIYISQPFKKLYFIMENVASMKHTHRDRITSQLSNVFLNTRIHKIDSAILAPAHRRRYYWTNIPIVNLPAPSNSKYQDIVINGYVDKEKANVLLGSQITLTNGINRYYTRNIGNLIYKDEAFARLPVEEKLLAYPFILYNSGHLGKSKSASDEYSYVNGCYRLPSVLESERLMTIPDGYVSDVPGISRTEKIKMIGLGFTIDMIAHLLSPLNEIY